MTIYHTNEFSFELPAGLKDKTLHVLSLHEDGPSPFSLVIGRSRVDANESIYRLVDRLLGELSRTLPAFDLVKKQSLTVDGTPAIEIEYNWSNQGAPMRQRQVAVLHTVPGGARQLLQITGTMTGPTGGDWNPAFDQVVQSIRLRQTDTPKAGPPLKERSP